MILNLLGILLAIPLFHLSWEDISGLINSNFESASPGFVKYFQAIQSMGFFLVPGFLLPAILFENTAQKRLGNASIGKFNYLLILLTIICSIPIINYLVVWNANFHLPSSLSGIEESLRYFEKEALQLTEQLLGGTSPLQIFIILCIVAVLPAIGEELIFRRIIQTILHKWFGNIHLAIVASGIFFSAFHMQFFGFFPRLVLGIYFGYLYYWSGSIRFAIWAHFLNNALAILLMQMVQSDNSWFTNLVGEEAKIHGNVLVVATLLTAILILNSRQLFNKKEISIGKEN